MLTARILTITVAVGTAAFAMVAPAQAMTGRDAVGKCIDNESKGCVWLMDKKGQIEIITGDNRYITCPNATSECTLHRKGQAGRTTAGKGGTAGIVAD